MGAQRLLLGLALLAGCSESGLKRDNTCSSDGDCTPGLLCLAGRCSVPPAPVEDLAVPPLPDLAVVPDLWQAPPDLADGGPCRFGERPCGMTCIPVAACCTDADCELEGQRCGGSGTCECPMGQRACQSACVGIANCCVDADCPMAACGSLACLAASCEDGIRNAMESDVDCGPGCGRCAAGRACSMPGDCRSNQCTAGRCVAATGFTVRRYGGGSEPNHLDVGDLDGDGKLDVVVANRSGDTVVVLRGRGDGNLDPRVLLFTGREPIQLALFDWDGDKRLDLTVLERGARTVSILPGDGKLGFGVPRTTALPTPPTGFAIADFDEDGRPDLAVSMGSVARVLVLPGTGGGAFDAPLLLPTDAVPTHVVAADFDGDRHVDLATTNGANLRSLTVARGRGNGRFGPVRPVKGLPDFAESLAVADLDGDGRLDLAVGRGNFTPLRGAGDGTFLVGPSVGRGSSVFVSIADLDGNGIPDVLTSNAYLLGAGGLAYRPGVAYPRPAVARHGVAADMNGDGKQDLVFAVATDHTVVVVLGKGDGTLVVPQPGPGAMGSVTELGAERFAGIALADWDGDKRADVLAPGPEDKSLRFYLGAQNGTLLPPAIEPNLIDRPAGVAVGDLDGDGLLDAVLGSSQSSAISIVIGGRGGRVGAVALYDPGMGVLPVLAIADVNGDGKLDVVGSGGNGLVVTLPGRGNGTFAPTLRTAQFANSPSGLALADFDGDKVLDVAASTSSGVEVLAGVGDGTFRMRRALNVLGPTRGGGIVARDLDGDGLADLVVSNSSASEVLSYLGKEGLGKPRAFTVGRSPVGVVVADLDGDGRLDVATADTSAATVSVLHGLGDGTFGPAVGYEVVWGPGQLAAGDVDGDGKIDLVVTHPNANSLTLLRNAR